MELPVTRVKEQVEVDYTNKEWFKELLDRIEKQYTFHKVTFILSVKLGKEIIRQFDESRVRTIEKNGIYVTQYLTEIGSECTFIVDRFYPDNKMTIIIDTVQPRRCPHCNELIDI